MKHTPLKHSNVSDRSQRPMVGLRMDPQEHAICTAYAREDSRSAGAFALLMYRRGLALWEAERAQSAPRQRRNAKT